MVQFLNLFCFEFHSSARRKALWIPYLLVFGFCIAIMAGSDMSTPSGQLWAPVAQNTYGFNMLLPIVGGILAADRMQRDLRLGVHELQGSTPLGWSRYVLAKYLGVLCSVLWPVLIGILADAIVRVIWGQYPAQTILMTLVTFAAITVPAYAFLVAFSLACPLVMPVRVYQILFTGYWVWGNYLNPEAFPTLAGTILTPGGIYALQGFFQTNVSPDPLAHMHTATEAVLNLLVLAVCIMAVLLLAERYLRRQAQHA